MEPWRNKPVTLPFWCLFFTLPPPSPFRLHRMTSMEREEKEKGKKREKKLEDEETMQQATWVKYTIPIKHQVNLGSLSSQVLFGLLWLHDVWQHNHPIFCMRLCCLLSNWFFLSVCKVWKQKGEEYRVTGYGGWSWVSKTHVHRFVPRLPGNTNVNYRKALEGKCFFWTRIIFVLSHWWWSRALKRKIWLQHASV